MSFVDKIAYGFSTNGQIDTYNDENWLGSESDYWEDTYEADANYGDAYWDYLEYEEETYNFDESETAISLLQEPCFDEDGTFGLLIDEDRLDYVAAVFCSVFYDTGDGDTILDLGIDAQTGQSAKEITKLQPGDIIVPTYNAYTMSTGEESLYYGYEYEFVGDHTLAESCLFAGDYYYSFLIDDIFGGTLYTRFALFTIDEEGNLYFEELDY